MAEKVGVGLEQYHYSPRMPFYCLTPTQRNTAIANGAIEIDPIGINNQCNSAFNKDLYWGEVGADE